MKHLYIFTLLFFVHLCQGQTVFRNENLGFSIEKPENWTIIEKRETLQNIEEHIKLKPELLERILNQNKGTIEIISFIKYPVDSHVGIIPTIKINLRKSSAKSLESFKKGIWENINGMKIFFPDLKIIDEPTVLKINGRNCIFSSFDYMLEANNGKEKASVFLYAIPNGDTFYQIALMDSEKENNTVIFEKVLKSIKID